MVIECKDYGKFKTMLAVLINYEKSARALELNCFQDLVKDYHIGRIPFWEKQLLISMEKVNRMEVNLLKRIDDTIKIEYRSHANFDLERTKAHAERLLYHMKRGKALKAPYFGLNAFSPSIGIRKKFYAVRRIYVNGKVCSTPKRLDLVIQDLTLKKEFWALSNIWGEHAKFDSYQQQHLFFKNHLLKVIELISIVEEAEKVRLEIQKNTNLQIKPFENKCFLRSAEESWLHKKDGLSDLFATEYSLTDVISSNAMVKA